MSIYAARGLLFHLWEPDEHETKENFPLKAIIFLHSHQDNYIAGNVKKLQKVELNA